MQEADPHGGPSFGLVGAFFLSLLWTCFPLMKNLSFKILGFVDSIMVPSCRVKYTKKRFCHAGLNNYAKEFSR
jgi:hypothetical protein